MLLFDKYKELYSQHYNCLKWIRETMAIESDMRNPLLEWYWKYSDETMAIVFELTKMKAELDKDAEELWLDIKELERDFI